MNINQQIYQQPNAQSKSENQ